MSKVTKDDRELADAMEQRGYAGIAAYIRKFGTAEMPWSFQGPDEDWDRDLGELARGGRSFPELYGGLPEGAVL